MKQFVTRFLELARGFAAHPGAIALAVLLPFLATGATMAEEATHDFSASDVPKAPLMIRDLTMPKGLGLGFRPIGNDLVGDGNWQLAFQYSHASHFIGSDNVKNYLETRDEPLQRTLEPEDIDAILNLEGDAYLLDGEFGMFSAMVGYGLTDRLQINLTIPYLVYTGGQLDGFIWNFHELLGLDQNGRELLAEDRFQMIYDVGEDPGTNTVIIPEPDDGLGDPTLGIQYAHPYSPKGWRWGFQVEGKAAISDEDELLSTGGTDYGAQVVLEKSWGNQALVFNAGYTFMGDFETPGAFEPDEVLSFSADWIHRWKGNFHGIFQIFTSDGVFEEGTDDSLSELEFELSYGVRWIRGGQAFTFAFTENLVSYDSTTDIAFHLAYAKRFR